MNATIYTDATEFFTDLESNGFVLTANVNTVDIVCRFDEFTGDFILIYDGETYGVYGGEDGENEAMNDWNLLIENAKNAI